jgi:hypothetical protein
MLTYFLALVKPFFVLFSFFFPFYLFYFLDPVERRKSLIYKGKTGFCSNVLLFKKGMSVLKCFFGFASYAAS